MLRNLVAASNIHVTKQRQEFYCNDNGLLTFSCAKMTTDSNTTTSPPAKRVKTDSTAMDNGSTVPVTNLDQTPPLLIKKLSDKARLPTRGSAFAAGYDLYAARETTIPARGKGLVDTDISMAVPAGTCMFCPFYVSPWIPSPPPAP